MKGTVIQPRALFGWGVLLFMLVVAADYNATAELASAFAIVILLSTAIALGPAAFANVSALVSGQQPA